MNKKIIIGILLTIIVIISIHNVNALGITPSKKIIEYDTEEHTISVRIINNEAKDMTLQISAGGPLADYVTIDEPIINIKSTEGEKEFTYKIKLPPDLTPGPKSIIVSVTEINTASDENTMSGLLAVSHQLQINVPYTGLYAEGYLSMSSTTQNDATVAALNVMNLGTENINIIKGTLNVKDLNGKIVYSKTIPEYKDTFPGTSIKIEELFNIGLSGKYIAEYDVDYDGKEITVSKEFYTGEYNITLINASVKNFKLGTIAKLDVDLSNNWNVPIEDIYGEIIITDLNGTIVGRANTSGATISPSTGVFTVYWDTANIKTGSYIINLKLHAGNKIITQEYPAIINNNEILIGLQKENQKINMYIVAVVLISLACIMLLILFRRRNKKIYK